MNKRILLLFLAALASLLASAQQRRTVTGTVYDFDGTPMTGVSIVVQGSQRGSISDENGKWSLEASTGETLEFWFLGYETIDRVLGEGDSAIEITMQVSANVLDDVVVVGYGAVKKSDLTGSVASVKMEAISDISATSVDGLLQGRAAGLQVINSSQDPGSGSTIRIRGNSSINGSNTPLVVVNGFPMGDAGALTQINTSDIESIEILKDASASAIYGSRGANGVILVTTKKADEGHTTATVKHQTVVSTLSAPVDIWYDPMLMAQVSNEEMANAGLNPVYIGQTIGGIYYPSLMEIQDGKWANTDWVDLCLRTPLTNSTTVSVNSANSRSSLNLNVNYFGDRGIYKKDDYDRLNLNIGYTYKILPSLL
ncbi:MAG: TonB-dependent receptor plug domain-containing protein, partial [Bacteroidales bacterium]|nr:TonB-dependent receptor plug domain-containing protein [Bacteroidales bacterium]